MLSVTIPTLQSRERVGGWGSMGAKRDVFQATMKQQAQLAVGCNKGTVLCPCCFGMGASTAGETPICKLFTFNPLHFVSPLTMFMACTMVLVTLFALTVCFHHQAG